MLVLLGLYYYHEKILSINVYNHEIKIIKTKEIQNFYPSIDNNIMMRFQLTEIFTSPHAYAYHMSVVGCLDTAQFLSTDIQK